MFSMVFYGLARSVSRDSERHKKTQKERKSHFYSKYYDKYDRPKTQDSIRRCLDRNSTSGRAPTRMRLYGFTPIFQNHRNSSRTVKFTISGCPRRLFQAVVGSKRVLFNLSVR
jgi:hypothetical protein